MSTTTLRSPEYIGSGPVERATWLSVLGYCAEQENKGRIAGALDWKDRQWQQTCGVTAEEVKNASKLLKYKGDVLVVFKYPIDGERKVKRLRKTGSSGGKAKAKKLQQMLVANGTGTHEANASTDKNRTEKRREDKNRTEKTTPLPPAGADAAVGEVVSAWNESGLPKVQKLTRKRTEHLRARLSSGYWSDNWRAALAKIGTSDWCRGRVITTGRTPWVADFDWFIRSDDAVTRTQEGKYDNRAAPKSGAVPEVNLDPKQTF